MRVYWRVQIETPYEALGWLVFEDGISIGVFNDDGTPAEDVKSYTTIDTNPAPPEWA